MLTANSKNANAMLAVSSRNKHMTSWWHTIAYYGILMCSLDPCQLYFGIGVVDMGPWGLQFHAEKNAPRRLSKRLDAPGKSEAETHKTTVTCQPCVTH